MADGCTIEVICHVYCPPGLDVYAQHLRFQVASLLHWPPQRCNVRLSYCYTPRDSITSSVISKLHEHRLTLPNNVMVGFYAFEPGELFRRAIGRNALCKTTYADVVWFTDVDYFFGPDCLDTVADSVTRDDELCMPSRILICRDHETGDGIVDGQRYALWPQASLSLFTEKRQGPCIGGVQIVGRRFCEQHGYLDGTKWVEPVDPQAGFRSCACDKAFRRTNNLKAKRLAIPSVYRLRHTKDGRDYDKDGKFVGRSAW